MRSQSISFQNVYLDSTGIIVSKKEKEGPLGKYFKNYINDYYFGCKTFEKAQTKLLEAAIRQCIRKSEFKYNNIDLAIGGDLSNQIFATTSALKEHSFPFLGVYAACASGILSIILAGIYFQIENYQNALCLTSSHRCVAEKQFRYPNEYGVQLKDTATTTITGAVALILTKKRKQIRISKCSIGKIVDVMSHNANDMGTIMAFAAIDTFLTHMDNFNETEKDYDLIVTGDLSRFGSKIFLENIVSRGFDISDHYEDCGNLIYDQKRQNIEAGGSGPTCVMAVTFSYIVNKMMLGIYNKVLIIGTGALHSQVSYQQKESIPCIAHAIVLEVSSNDA